MLRICIQRVIFREEIQPHVGTYFFKDTDAILANDIRIRKKKAYEVRTINRRSVTKDLKPTENKA